MHAHNIHWKPRVIAREENTHKRKVKEALAIKKLTAQNWPEVAMNQDTGLIVSKLWLDLAKVTRSPEHTLDSCTLYCYAWNILQNGSFHIVSKLWLDLP